MKQQRKTDGHEGTRYWLDELDGLSPVDKCSCLKSGNDNGYLNSEQCRKLAKAFTDAAEFLEKNDTSNN